MGRASRLKAQRRDNRAQGITSERKVIHRPKTLEQRAKIVHEIQAKLEELNIVGESASRKLIEILQDYLMHGKEYHEEIELDLRADRPRKFVVNLYNDLGRMDQVTISPRDT